MTDAPAPPLTEEIEELVASGLDIHVATRNAALEPESMMAIGARVHPDRRTFTVYLPEALAEPTRKNLLENGEVAVCLCRPRDNRAVQLKGKFLRLRPSDENDREIQQLGRAAFIEQLAFVGVPRTVSRRLVWWPSLALEFGVQSVFQQTPGPGAGEPLRSVTE